MSLGILSGRRLSPSVCDLTLVGNARQEVRAGTAAPAGGSGKQALVLCQLWTEDVHWPNWGARPGLSSCRALWQWCLPILIRKRRGLSHLVQDLVWTRGFIVTIVFCLNGSSIFTLPA